VLPVTPSDNKKPFCKRAANVEIFFWRLYELYLYFSSTKI